MSFEAALRATEILLALSLLQASLEHLFGTRGALGFRGDWPWFAPRAALSGALLVGVAPAWTLAGLLVVSLFILDRFQGPYNGGADRMGLLTLICLTGAHWGAPVGLGELCLAYLGLQLVLSYVMSGWVKIVNPAWRSGDALRDVFLFSAYPVSEAVRGWAAQPQLLKAMGWGVMLFELAFPLALLAQPALMAALALAAAFHIANAVFFGLNRFVWTWIAAYPALLWLQERFAIA